MPKQASRTERRKKRHQRIRKNIIGSFEKPRLNIYKSNTKLYAQIIDDEKGNTLVGLSSINFNDEEFKSKKSISAAKMLGKQIAELALKQNIKKVVFDRGGNLYHGKIKAFAEAARENGLEF